MSFHTELKCPTCGKGSWCRREDIARVGKFVSWFNRKIRRDSTAKYTQGPYKVFCDKCDTRRPELEKRDYVSK